MTEHQRQRAQERRHRGHQDRAKAQHAGLADGLFRLEVPVALGRDRKIDHHDSIFLDDADQQQDSDNGDDRQVKMKQGQDEQGSNACRRKRRKNRERVNIAFVQHAKDDVDRDDCCKDEQRLAGERRLERSRRALECAHEGGRHLKAILGCADRLRRLSERHARRQIERQRYRRKLALMVD